MSEREPKSGGAGCVIAIVVLMLVAILYALSIGPAARMVWEGYLTGGAFKVVYGPVDFLAHSAGLAGARDWYVSLFVNF